MDGAGCALGRPDRAARSLPWSALAPRPAPTSWPKLFCLSQRVADALNHAPPTEASVDIPGTLYNHIPDLKELRVGTPVPRQIDGTER